jgi:hypothetical protein
MFEQGQTGSQAFNEEILTILRASVRKKTWRDQKLAPPSWDGYCAPCALCKKFVAK